MEDGPLGRLLWTAIARTGSRRLAAAAMQASSRSDRGWERNVFRVAARHRWSRAPGVVKLPEGLWQAAPEVRARRLGLALELDLRDNLQRTLFFTGTYEPGVLRFLRRTLRRGDVFVDAGAHVGVHALSAARRLAELGGGRVYAFEPAPDSAAALRAAAARNGLAVEVVELALASAPGEAGLFAEPGYEEADAGVRSLVGTGARVATVRAVRFDDWAAGAGLDRLDVVKLDVEGAEEQALEGMARSLETLRPRALVVELKHAAGIPPTLTASGYEPADEFAFGNRVFVQRPFVEKCW